MNYGEAVHHAFLAQDPGGEEVHVPIAPTQALEILKDEPVRIGSVMVTMDGRWWEAVRVQSGEPHSVVYKPMGRLRLDYVANHLRLVLELGLRSKRVQPMHIVPDLRSTDENEEPAEQSRLSKAIRAQWFGLMLIVLGWGPLFLFGLVTDALEKGGLVGPHFGVGYGMGWGTLIAVPATILGMCSILVHLIRAVYRAIVRR